LSRPPLHSWSLDPREAAEIQKELRSRLSLVWEGNDIKSVAGIDISLRGAAALAAIVVLRYPGLEPLEGVTAEAPLVFPYIPGLLAFREGPAVMAAWELLSQMPDLLMFDGQGVAHPRGVGIASQMGLWLDRPAIGVAKSWLYGKYQEPGPHPGAFAGLFDPKRPERQIGAVLRTKENVKPLFISPGHKIDVAASIQFVMGCVAGYRLPETTRWAHRVAGGEVLPKGEFEQGKLLE
jgi:deoxyribonuclease V